MHQSNWNNGIMEKWNWNNGTMDKRNNGTMEL